MTDTPFARNTDPGTSHSAAAAFLPLVKVHEGRILEALVRPMTCYEIADAARMDHVAVARRMRKLVDESKVLESGETRPGPNGRPCTVWERA